MSPANTDLVQRVVQAFNHHDAPALQALCTADVELLPVRAALEDSAYRGPTAVAEMFMDFDESWDGLNFEIEEVRDADDHVLVTARLRGRGRVTGVAVDARLYPVMSFREGLLAGMRTYTDREDALAAVGLRA
jgi:ketosteroid isomerase-like protein